VKTKLTLYLPVQVITQAKTYARRRKVTVSALVEKHLAHLSCNAEQPGFSARWTGRFPSPDATTDDPRLAHLLQKHVK
jgi:hypothetical protein